MRLLMRASCSPFGLQGHTRCYQKRQSVKQGQDDRKASVAGHPRTGKGHAPRAPAVYDLVLEVELAPLAGFHPGLLWPSRTLLMECSMAEQVTVCQPLYCVATFTELFKTGKK